MFVLAWLGTVSAQPGGDGRESGSADGISVQARVPFGGALRQSRFVSTVVNVVNDGPDRAIDVELVSSDAEHEVSLDLARGSRRRVFLAVPISHSFSWIRVVLRDAETDDVLIELRPRTRRLNSERVIAFVDKRPPALKQPRPDANFDFDQPERTLVARMKVADLPDIALAYSTLDVLLWAQPRPDLLTADQLRALLQWVAMGGHLVVAIDDDWRKVAGTGLADVLPMTLTGVDVVERPPRIDAGLPTPERFPLLRGTPRPGATGATPLIGGDEALVLSQPVADGRVTLWRTSWHRFADEHFTLYQWETWTQHDVSRPTDVDLWTTVQADEPPLDIQGHWVLLVLFVYILVIGPLDFVVLKRLKRLEWTVATYTTSIVLFSGLAWLTVSGSTDDVTVVSSMDVVTWRVGKGIPDDLRRRVDRFDGYFTSRRKRIDLAVEGGSVWLDRTTYWGSELTNTQEFVGPQRRLTTTAPAYALTPIRSMRFEAAPAEPVGVDYDDQGGAVVHNYTDFRLDRCFLRRPGLVTERVFSVPARGSADLPDLLSAPANELDLVSGIDQFWLRSFGRTSVSGGSELFCTIDGDPLDKPLPLLAERRIHRAVFRFLLNAEGAL